MEKLEKIHIERHEAFNRVLNENIEILSKLYKQEDKQVIKSFIYDEVDKFNVLLPIEALLKAIKYSVELIKNELK